MDEVSKQRVNHNSFLKEAKARCLCSNFVLKQFLKNFARSKGHKVWAFVIIQHQCRASATKNSTASQTVVCNSDTGKFHRGHIYMMIFLDAAWSLQSLVFGQERWEVLCPFLREKGERCLTQHLQLLPWLHRCASLCAWEFTGVQWTLQCTEDLGINFSVPLRSSVIDLTVPSLVNLRVPTMQAVFVWDC